jgi:hypothetical protein
VFTTIATKDIEDLPGTRDPTHNGGGGNKMIRGVKFASIPVTDQDKALAFYTEKLGFRIVTDQPFNESHAG